MGGGEPPERLGGGAIAGEAAVGGGRDGFGGSVEPAGDRAGRGAERGRGGGREEESGVGAGFEVVQGGSPGGVSGARGSRLTQRAYYTQAALWVVGGARAGRGGGSDGLSGLFYLFR